MVVCGGEEMKEGGREGNLLRRREKEWGGIKKFNFFFKILNYEKKFYKILINKERQRIV